jgi:KaiC/GvpD/RAD55 family RecA-like ATPase
VATSLLEQVVAPPAAQGGVLRTGAPRLDDLLGGGFPRGGSVLLFGPPFCGKVQLAWQALAATLGTGGTGLAVLHGIGAPALRRRLAAIDARMPAAEAEGRLRILDCFANRADPEALAQAAADGTPTLTVVESASALLMEHGAPRAFKGLRRLLGRVTENGGVALVVLESGMHPEAVEQMAKHLSSGMLEFRRQGEGFALRVEGLETGPRQPGWVSCHSTSSTFALTGGFALRRIH